jgi:leader peptidase (prepilin peptidase)/N-methyltransferase
MGFGDVKLALSMGLWVGWMRTDGLAAFSVVLYAMLMGFALGTVAGLAVMAVRRRSAPYPFGPFLVLGALLAILLSDSLPR